MRLVPVARIGKPRGFRGEVWLDLYRDGFPALKTGDAVWIGTGDASRQVAVKEAFTYDKGTVLHLEGFDGVEAARSISGTELLLPEEQVPEDTEDTFDTDEVIGWEVEDATRGPIGRVCGVRSGPAYWVFLVEAEAGEVEIPAVKGLGVRLEKARRVVRTDLPGGYPGIPGDGDEV